MGAPVALDVRAPSPFPQQLPTLETGRSLLARKTVRYRLAVSRPSENWRQVLEGFERNDPLAIAKVTDVIIGYLHYYRAYDRRSSWDDLCQDVLISLLRTLRRGGLRDPGAFVAYTGTITRNRLANLAQRQERKDRELRSKAECSEAHPHALDTSRAPGSEALRCEVLMDLERALTGLPERCRRVVESIYLHGYSYRETSDRLSINLAAVKRDQIKGLKALRNILGIRR
jgi:RNA polymerase sigma factor (sigma-70 family)